MYCATPGCRAGVRLTFDALGLADVEVFCTLAKCRRFVCRHSGKRAFDIMPDWTDTRRPGDGARADLVSKV